MSEQTNTDDERGQRIRAYGCVIMPNDYVEYYPQSRLGTDRLGARLVRMRVDGEVFGVWLSRRDRLALAAALIDPALEEYPE